MSQEQIARVIRPINEKHEVRGVIAFLITRDGVILEHSDGDPEAIEKIQNYGFGGPSRKMPKRPRAKKAKV